MEYQHRFRWENIERIGSGGQGVVYRVFDKNRFDIEKSILPSVVRSIPSLTGLGYVEGRKLAFDEFVKCINDIVQLQDMSNHAALKELHQPADARDFEHAEARLRREIEAMQRISHPHLLEILDTDPDLKWHVSNFHSKGTLANPANACARRPANSAWAPPAASPPWWCGKRAPCRAQTRSRRTG